jgi:hypothetical protein
VLDGGRRRGTAMIRPGAFAPGGSTQSAVWAVSRVLRAAALMAFTIAVSFTAPVHLDDRLHHKGRVTSWPGRGVRGLRHVRFASAAPIWGPGAALLHRLQRWRGGNLGGGICVQGMACGAASRGGGAVWCYSAAVWGWRCPGSRLEGGAMQRQAALHPAGQGLGRDRTNTGRAGGCCGMNGPQGRRFGSLHRLALRGRKRRAKRPMASSGAGCAAQKASARRIDPVSSDTPSIGLSTDERNRRKG